MHQSLARQQTRLNAGFPLVLFTDDRDADWVGVARALPPRSLVVVRARNDARRARLAEALAPVARLLIAGDADLAVRVGAAGLHLPEARAHEAMHWRVRRPGWIITVSAHSLRALMGLRAVDAAFLSPVFSTTSHPGGRALGPVRAALVAARSPAPVYALGGVTARNAGLLASSFSGIAAIGGLLE